MDNIDILNPLCRAAWLIHIAARPGWFGFAFARHEAAQSQLFVQVADLSLALEVVANNAYRQLGNDAAVVALRHQLATDLALHIGPGLVNTAMRARVHTSNVSLAARHLNLVWQHRAAFDTMERENPVLLPALTAWLLHDKNNDMARLPDALPQMRRDVLAAGLPPRAWRCLAQYGIRRLLPSQTNLASWKALLASLSTLNAARWPALPPRSFLRLLHDTAGRPDTQDTAAQGMPGWFWQMACNEASACKGDTRAYLELFDRIPHWAWLVREFGLEPDNNQRRKGIAWLREVARTLEQFPPEDDAPAWALWLLAANWNEVPRLQVVPLLSPNALLREAIALHNCADGYVTRCRQESNLLLSLRNPGTGRPVALVCLERSGATWRLGQVAGPCNKPAPGWVRITAAQAAEVVRYHHSRLLPSQNPPPTECGRPLETP